MNKLNTYLVPAGFIAGVSAVLLMGATAAPEATPAPAPVVQTLNAEPAPTPTPEPVAPTPTVTDVPVVVDTPVNGGPATADPAPEPEPTPTDTPATPAVNAPLTCAPWMEGGWLGLDGQPTSCIWAMSNPGGTLELKACAEEDSQDCYWDATIRGDRTGRSFINIRGHYFYEETR